MFELPDWDQRLSSCEYSLYTHTSLLTAGRSNERVVTTDTDSKITTALFLLIRLVTMAIFSHGA